MTSIEGPAARILLVDDHHANLLALEAILEPLQQNLVRATSGEEALKCLLQSDFAAILMDVQMPGMDGFETAKMIKQHERCRSIPIIFLTALNREASHIFKGYAHGAVDYLLKPFEPEILKSKVSVFVDLFLRGERIKQQAAMLFERDKEALERARLYEVEKRARAEAEAAIRAREDVLAIVSHDLRNPLSAIYASSTLLSHHIPGDEKGERARRHVDIIRRSAERMQSLISDLLDLSRIEGGRFSIDAQFHDVNVIVNQAIEMVQASASSKKLHWNNKLLGQTLEIFCDRDRVSQVLSNLLGNAVKFTPDGGELTVELNLFELELRFTIRDTGPGIPPDQLPHIFERYWRANPKSRLGLGLGLAIAKGIVEAHEGRIWVESRSLDKSGSAFHFTLPLPDHRMFPSINAS